MKKRDKEKDVVHKFLLLLSRNQASLLSLFPYSGGSVLASLDTFTTLLLASLSSLGFLAHESLFNSHGPPLSPLSSLGFLALESCFNSHGPPLSPLHTCAET